MFLLRLRVFGWKMIGSKIRDYVESSTILNVQLRIKERQNDTITKINL
jgi:hypothetical protein